MIRCTKCGTTNADGSTFCAGCRSFLEFVGEPVDEKAANAEPATVARATEGAAEATANEAAASGAAAREAAAQEAAAQEAAAREAREVAAREAAAREARETAARAAREAAAQEAVGPEVARPEVARPEVARPEVARPEAARPEVAALAPEPGPAPAQPPSPAIESGPPAVVPAPVATDAPARPPAIVPASPATDTPALPPVVPTAVLPVTHPSVPVQADQPAAREPTLEAPVAAISAATPPPKRQRMHPGDVVCPSCGEPNDPHRHLCQVCGASLAAREVPRRIPWWRRLFQRRRRTFSAGERPAAMTAGPSASAAAKAGRSLRSLLMTVLVIAFAAGAGGYLAVPSLHSAVNSAVRGAMKVFAQPVKVVPTGVTSSGSTAGHGPELAIDGANNRYWAAASAQPWIEFTFNQPFDFANIIFTPGASDSLAASARPKEVAIHFWDAAGKTVAERQVTLDDGKLVGGEGGKTVLAMQKIDISADNASRVRITIVSTYPGSQPVAALTEVEFFYR